MANVNETPDVPQASEASRQDCPLSAIPTASVHPASPVCPDASARPFAGQRAPQCPGQPVAGQSAFAPQTAAPAYPSAPAYPAVPMPPAAYPDPRASVPDSLRPGAHHVHHTYIWLGGAKAALSTLVAIAVVAFGNIFGKVVSGDASDSLPALMVLVPFVLIGIVLLVVLIVGLVFLVQWLLWKNLTYELGPDEVSLHSGVINKKHMHVPYQRVQGVNQVAGLFQRLVGVCNVKIDTAGGAANDGIILQYVRASDAEALRAELFRRKKVLLAGGTIAPDGTATVGGATYLSAWALACSGIVPNVAAQGAMGFAANPSGTPAEGNVLDAADEVLSDVRGVFGGGEVDTGAVSYETGLSNKELALAGASGAGEQLGLMAAGAAAAVATIGQFFEGAIEDWVEGAVEGALGSYGVSDLGDVGQAAGSLVSAATVQIILFIVLGAVVLWALAALGTIVRYGGFRLRRRESRVEVESGLLSRTFHGVDVDRIQSVEVKQGFIRRLMGYCELSVAKINSGVSGSESGSEQAAAMAAKGVVIHPFVKVSRVPEIIEAVLPEFADMPQEAIKPGNHSLRRAIVRFAVLQSGAFWFAVVAVLCHVAIELAMRFVPMDAVDASLLSTMRLVIFAYYGAFAVLFAFNVANAVLWHRRSALGYDSAFMSVTNGGFTVETTYIPRRKIQFACVAENPFQRRLGLATVCATTAAGVSGDTLRLRDVEKEDAEAWMEWVRPRGTKKPLC